MLNVWMILMFGSGMPLLYIVGTVLLMTQDLVERHCLTRLCTQPVRYGPRLPFLLLGECGCPVVRTVRHTSSIFACMLGCADKHEHNRQTAIAHMSDMK